MALTSEETLVFRSLKRTAVVLMLARYLDRPFGEGDIAAILDMDHKTVRAHLRSLASLGLLTRTHYHQGYQLTHAGRQLALPLEPGDPHPALTLPAPNAPGEFTELPGDGPPEEPGVMPFGEPGDPHPACKTQGIPTGESALSPPGLPSPRHPLPLDPGDSPGCLTINTDNNKDISHHESIIRINHHAGRIPVSANSAQHHTALQDGVGEGAAARPDVPGFSPADGPSADSPEVSELPPDDPRLVAGALAAVGVVLNARTRKLLGRISTEDVEAVYRDLVRKRKGSETGLLIYMLEKIADPEQPYLEFPDNPWGHQRSTQTEASEEDLEEFEAAEAGAVETAFDGPPEIERAWETALSLIRAELPQAAFDTWLAHAIPLAWQAETEVLTVGVANSFARDYLNERVKYFILPYLAGILHCRGVSIEFVVMNF